MTADLPVGTLRQSFEDEDQSINTEESIDILKKLMKSHLVWLKKAPSLFGGTRKDMT